MDHEIRVLSGELLLEKISALHCICGGVWDFEQGGVTCHEIDTQSRPQDISRAPARESLSLSSFLNNGHKTTEFI